MESTLPTSSDMRTERSIASPMEAMRMTIGMRLTVRLLFEKKSLLNCSKSDESSAARLTIDVTNVEAGKLIAPAGRPSKTGKVCGGTNRPFKGATDRFITTMHVPGTLLSGRRGISQRHVRQP